MIALKPLLQSTEEVARKAGALIMTYFDKDIEVLIKEGGHSLASQVVTKVDKEAQDLILDLLSPYTKEYNFGILTEESEDNNSRFEKDYFWCIDPLDGTLPFTEKKEGFAVSIALVNKNGQAVLGVIYNPITEDIYSAALDLGAYKNHQPFSITYNNFYTLVCDRSSKSTEWFKEAIHKYQPKDIIDFGGACMNAIWVLENAPALYFKPTKQKLGGGSIWDYASSSILFKELGLPATTFDGQELPLNKRNHTFMNDCGIYYSSEKPSIS
ncbi:inositol monophosphatase [Flammeovirga sp. SubArs3]|uniref:3'(2'),5'-bisphosphate nucleotidase CysQ family protein n=1 Tax=Flammeovirga sp. SubArs3 TaxID=2995316 RepID=UPI00248C5A88|nr:inositol monophosphatase [Flammeovirga sp. SubArs3]